MSPTVHVTRSRIVSFRDGSEHAAPWPESWYITHGFGGPAERTYTEVRFSPEALVDTDGRPLPTEVLHEAARLTADALYRDRWSFLYPPEEYDRSVALFDLVRRETVLVEHIDVW